LVDHVSFPYRAPSHLPFLHVVAESGSWEKYGLDVNYNYMISSRDAHLEIPSMEVEFVGGNHVSTYAQRVHGDTWTYLGQTMNFTNVKLVVRPDSDIAGVPDLRGKKVGVRGMHPGLNDWLYLKQRGLDEDRDDVELIGSLADSPDAPQPPLWDLLLDGSVDAIFQTPPGSIMAERAGLKVIDVDPLPMIWFTTISTSSTFIENHPDIVDRFLKGLLEGVHYFKTRQKESTKIIKDMYDKEGPLDDEMAGVVYSEYRRLLEPKLYPTMEAISNVYQEGIRLNADARRVNPMELWDLHALRRIDDSGFIRDLYKDTNIAP
jgi:ABC-type nitrate/sulfonate/bicarbonate transport system substrate-binding protein